MCSTDVQVYQVVIEDVNADYGVHSGPGPENTP